MNRTNDINNRIEDHLILSNGEVSTNGITLGFDERMNMNPSKFKRLGIRKIKCEMVENPGYRFSMGIVWYDRSQGYSEMHFGHIKINLTDQTFNVITEEIKYQINSFLQDNGTPHRFDTNTRFDNVISIE
jgi:hypothetical protein